MKNDKTELPEKNLKYVTGGKKTSCGHTSAGVSQSDVVNPSTTKAWFGTADETDSYGSKLPGFFSGETEQ